MNQTPSTLKLDHVEEPKIVQSVSFAKQLLSPSYAGSDIPAEISSSPALRIAVRKRRALIRSFDDIENSPNKFSKEKLKRFYIKISEALNEDESLTRLILYFPFNLMPSADTSDDVEKDFLSSYKNAFYKLLSAEDLRADFYDGDIPEENIRRGSLPKVIKVVHLIPTLLQIGILKQEDIIKIFNLPHNDTLTDSLIDILSILVDMDAINADLITLIEESGNEKLIRSLKRLAPHNHKNENTNYANLDSLHEDFEKELTQQITLLTKEYITEARRRWKEVDIITKIGNKYSKKLFNSILSGEIPLSVLEDKYSSSNINAKFIMINTLILLIKTDPSIIAKDTLLRLIALIKKDEDENLLKKSITNLYNLLHKNNQATNDIKRTVPQYEDEAPTTMTKSYRELMIRVAKNIEEDTELSTMIYPCVLSVGSYAKGYATEKSDKDFAIFVRPGTREEDREKIQSLLKNINAKSGGDLSFMEFWLEENNSELIIKNYDAPDPKRGDFTLTHPYTGDWASHDTKENKSLREKLILNYFRHQNDRVLGSDYRSLWLRSIEQNLLQYRLMHSGFSNYYKALNVDLSDHYSIDGDGAFYDDEYRRVATSIYLKNIFIPKI